MINSLLFLQGAGEGAYVEDQQLVNSLREHLGPAVEIRYPEIEGDGDASYDAWCERIGQETADMIEPIAIVGHSVGASVLIKWIGEQKANKRLGGIFLLAAPFWGGDGWKYDGFEEMELPHDVADRILGDIPVYLYHSRDDEVVPFDHLELYARSLPLAQVRALGSGGHQLGNDLSDVARQIRSIA